MARFCSPPIADIPLLKNAPNESELSVVKFFNRFLDDDWEIYFNPHLNGLRPDIVLLHPRVGIAVYEIKDWDLSKYHRDYSNDDEMIPNPLYFTKGGAKVFIKDPIDQAQLYKNEILNLYLPSLGNGYVAKSILTAGIIFTNASKVMSITLFGDYLQKKYYLNYKPNDVCQFNPIIGMDDLKLKDIDLVFPEHKRKYSRFMNHSIYMELKNWLVEPSMPRDQRTPLDIMLDPTQKRLATDPNPAKLRRIKGPAGSGKSLVLAARAAELTLMNKKVLVVTYNITLRNYLQDLAVRWKRSTGSVRHKIVWINFHSLCKRVCYQYGMLDEYKLLWSDKESAFTEKLSALVNHIDVQDSDKFDAILVDEGQDFRLSWWNVLRNKLLKDDGEMLLVADSTQDIYETAKAWTEEAMTGAGFRGKWNELSISYRLPSQLLSLVQEFANRYLPSETRIIPQPRQKDIFDDESAVLKWIQVQKVNVEKQIVESVLNLIECKEKEPLAVSDITILVPSNSIGVEVVRRLGLKGIRVLNTFKISSPEEQRKKKLGFFMGDASIKATTIHSFKGWESKSLIIYTGSTSTPKDLALFYTSITRLKIDYGFTSYLTVISDNEMLLQYGKNWPYFLELKEI